MVYLHSNNKYTLYTFCNNVSEFVCDVMVFTAFLVKNKMFWDIAPFQLISTGVSEGLSGSKPLKMERARFSQT